MNKTKILIIAIALIGGLLLSGCVETRPVPGKVGNTLLGTNQTADKPYIIEKLGDNSYRIVSKLPENAIQHNYVDVMTLGYMDIDSKCDIKYAFGVVGNDGRSYAGSSTTEIIVKTYTGCGV